jgi:hypothetical protein
MSENGLKNKIIEVQKVSLAKVEDKNIVTFDKQGGIHYDSVPEEKRADTEFYVQVLLRLLKWVLRVKLKVRNEDRSALLHDNAPAHSAMTVKHLQAQHIAAQ